MPHDDPVEVDAEMIGTVADNAASAVGAARTSSWVPPLDDQIARSDSCTGDAKETMMPTPGFSAGNCWR